MLKLGTGHLGGMPWKPITGLRKAIGIDFDFRDKKIIFSDINQRKINSDQFCNKYNK